jgi:hypothetical protein
MEQSKAVATASRILVITVNPFVELNIDFRAGRVSN